MKAEERRGGFPWALAGVFLLLGTLHWVLFFGVPPRLPREQADWPKEFRYYAVLTQAVTELRIPYFISEPIQDTRKFLAIPEVVVSPQIVLLRFLSVDAFFVVHVVLLQAAALLGCLLLRRRYALSLESFTLLFLLLSWNGHITSHLAIGHSMWGGYFLFPFLFWLVLEMVERPENARSPFLAGLVMLGILLQGSSHAFVWCVLLLLLLLAFGSAPRRLVAEALAWSAALGLVRLAPAAAVLLGRREHDFQTGYPGLADVLAGLVWIRDVTFPRRGSGSMGGLQWWEFDAFVGLPALVALALFGIGLGLARGRPAWRRLAAPLAVMTALSMGPLYLPFHLLNVPLLNSQRVSSRLFIVPLGLLIVIACAAGDEWMRRARRGRAVMWAVVLLTAALLVWHSWVWSVPQVAALLPPPPKPRKLDVWIVEPAAYAGRDALYRTVVKVAALVSLGAAILGTWRFRRTARPR